MLPGFLRRVVPSSTRSIWSPYVKQTICRQTITHNFVSMAKRKRLGTQTGVGSVNDAIPSLESTVAAIANIAPVPIRRSSSRRTQPAPAKIDVNPDTNPKIEDGQEALRASPDAAERIEGEGKKVKTKTKASVQTKSVKQSPPVKIKVSASESDLSELSDMEDPTKAKPKPVKKTSSMKKPTPVKKQEDVAEDPEVEGEEDADPEEIQEALSRPPPVNSSYLPLPWKGRIGYACLNTYLRAATPPVFSSRTCRIASILEHRHPLKDPSQPEHATKNRPDKTQPPDVARGQAYVEALGIANARDIPKMLRWNDRYGIKFMRLSSEMFPFASHEIYGYKLAPFASEVLAEAGRVAAELGHRLTSHVGQFTQLGSPRPEVITAAIRDLEYHCEMFDLMKLPPQQNRDGVLILHMGGIFGDKTTAIARFKENYAQLSDGIKARLVLENDDVCYTVHDLLPVCEELNIPLVLDYHHHNILFDADKIREGTKDIMDLYPRIKATWDRKNITQKMHYSEPTPAAVTARQRRKHSPRVATLPPCVPDMDLMIEAKDKEQAVFELMRIFKLPQFDTFNDILPYTRGDENKPWKPPKKKKAKKGAEDDDEPEPQPPPIIPEDEVAMGGPEGRVYWPPGMEEWLRPKKREVKPRDPEKAKTTAEKAAQRRAEKADWQAAREASAENASVSEQGDAPSVDLAATKSVYDKPVKGKPVRAPRATKAQKSAKAVPTPTPSTSDDEKDDVAMPDLTDAESEEVVPSKKPRVTVPSISRRQSGRGARQKVVNYIEGDED